MTTKITTPKSWPEAAWPTPEQYLAWFLACTPEEQLHLAGRHVDDGQRALACLLAHHDDLAAENEHLTRVVRQAGSVVQRYRAAWLSAWRRAERLRQASTGDGHCLDCTWVEVSRFGVPGTEFALLTPCKEHR